MRRSERKTKKKKSNALILMLYGVIVIGIIYGMTADINETKKTPELTQHSETTNKGVNSWYISQPTTKPFIYDTDSASKISFTNTFGTPTTKCFIRGCTAYIASSGNTNCCTYHSNKCFECRCYIDSDAAFCISCLKKAIENVKKTRQ